jgi:hypothetical protein
VLVVRLSSQNVNYTFQRLSTILVGGLFVFGKFNGFRVALVIRLDLVRMKKIECMDEHRFRTGFVG